MIYILCLLYYLSVQGEDFDAALNLINGTQNEVVWARGPIVNDALSTHSSQGVAMQDFLANLGTTPLLSSALDVNY